MATLTRVRHVPSDAYDIPRDLRLGIPSPFPANALAREEDELLDSLADEELQLDEAPTISEPRERDIEVPPDDSRMYERPTVSVWLLISALAYSCSAGGPPTVNRSGTVDLPGDIERPVVGTNTLGSHSS